MSHNKKRLGEKYTRLYVDNKKGKNEIRKKHGGEGKAHTCRLSMLNLYIEPRVIIKSRRQSRSSAPPSLILAVCNHHHSLR